MLRRDVVLRGVKKSGFMVQKMSEPSRKVRNKLEIPRVESFFVFERAKIIAKIRKYVKLSLKIELKSSRINFHLTIESNFSNIFLTDWQGKLT